MKSYNAYPDECKFWIEDTEEYYKNILKVVLSEVRDMIQDPFAPYIDGRLIEIEKLLVKESY